MRKITIKPLEGSGTSIQLQEIEVHDFEVRDGTLILKRIKEEDLLIIPLTTLEAVFVKELPKKLSDYQKFVKEKIKEGKSLIEAASEWKKVKG